MNKLSIITVLLCAWLSVSAQSENFCIAKNGKTATIIIDENDWKGVIRAAKDLGDDVRKVTGVASPIVSFAAMSSQQIKQPSSVIGMYLTLMPRFMACNCQGTMFEWCSISVTSTSSPGCI